MSAHPVAEELGPKPADGVRLTLHAPATHFYWVFIAICVIALVSLPGALVHLLRENPGKNVLFFGAIASGVLVTAIVYFQVKTRWVVADVRGLTITERSRVRTVPWRKVRCLIDLGYWGSTPGARRHHVEFKDGEYFTFLADPDAMSRLDALRGSWGIEAER